MLGGIVPSAMVYMSAEEAAHRCGVSPKTVRRWVRSGRLKADKRGRSFRIDPEQLAPFMGQGTPPNGDTAQQGTGDTGQGRDHREHGTRNTSAVALIFGELAATREMVNERDRTILEPAGRVGYFQAQLEQARERILMLEASKEPAPSPEPTPPSEADSRASGGLWSRLVGWFGG
jgi:excisionase family DNA binding protein